MSLYQYEAGCHQHIDEKKTVVFLFDNSEVG